MDWNKMLTLLCLILCFASASLGELIKGVGSGKCITAAGSNNANGAKEVISPCSPDFQWNAEKSATQNGYYLKSQSNQKCFAVAGASNSNGAEIIQWECADAPNFLWNFLPTSNGHYQIVGLGSNKCATVAGGSSADGAGLVIWKCAEAGNFLWDVGSLATPTPTPFAYPEEPQGSGMVYIPYTVTN